MRAITKPDSRPLGWRLGVAAVTCCLGMQAVAQDAPREAAVNRRVLAKILDINDCRPPYPRESLQANESGNTVVWLRIAADGALMGASVSRSSGHPRLDEAAVQALSRCKFAPGTFDGQAVESATTVSYRWRIEPPKSAPPCRPEYPAESIQAVEHGTTVLRVWLSASGAVEKAEVEKSSGFQRLDRAAVAGLASCKFRLRPGADGETHARSVRAEYVWRLEEGAPSVQAQPWAPPAPDPYRPL